MWRKSLVSLEETKKEKRDLLSQSLAAKTKGDQVNKISVVYGERNFSIKKEGEQEE
jgi:hypothetical protein